ncbi:MAG: hypothetical protein K2Y32_08895 [Candidatus Obscuribacterales bacterium]|nr:hypothetical protein [Candidatus Obscuribacterales bacterium]
MAEPQEQIQKAKETPEAKCPEGSDSAACQKMLDETREKEKQPVQELSPEVRTNAALVKALSHLSENPKLQEKIAGPDGRIDKQDLVDALLLNGQIKRDGRLPTGIDGFLSDADKAAVQELLANFNGLNKKSFDIQDLENFKPEKLGAGGKPLLEELEKLNPREANSLSPQLDEFLKRAIKRGITPDELEVAPPPYPGEAPIRMVRTADFPEASLSLFDRINKNKDQFLSDKELATALEDPSFKREDAQTLAALYFYRHRLASGAADGKGGVTRKDLEAFGELEKTVSKDMAAAYDVESVGRNPADFKKLDRGNKGFLTKADLEAAVEDKTLKSDLRDAAEIILRNYDVLPDANDDYRIGEWRGITAKDLQKFSWAMNESPDYKAMKETAHAMRRTYWGQLNQVESLYKDNSKPLESIKPDAINQGLLNDCYLLASIGAVSYSDPELVRDMIKDNGDGTFTVTFPGAKNEPISVKSPTEAERGLFNQPGEYGIWASVLEKAYGAYCQRSVFRRTPLNLGGGDSPAEGADGGGWYSALGLFTGRPYQNHVMPLVSNKYLAQKLDESLNKQPIRPVIADTGPGRPFYFTPETKDGYARAHIYTVLAYDPKGPDGGTVTVRNPWGGAKGSRAGEYSMSFEEFDQNFFNIAYGEK